MGVKNSSETRQSDVGKMPRVARPQEEIRCNTLDNEMPRTPRYVVAFLALCSIAGAATPIQTENAQQGTTAWQLSNPATNREIEGFASLTSVNQGAQISLFVNTADPAYTLEIYRIGWYGGAGSRQVLGPVVL